MHIDLFILFRSYVCIFRARSKYKALRGRHARTSVAKIRLLASPGRGSEQAPRRRTGSKGCSSTFPSFEQRLRVAVSRFFVVGPRVFPRSPVTRSLAREPLLLRRLLRLRPRASSSRRSHLSQPLRLLVPEVSCTAAMHARRHAVYSISPVLPSLSRSLTLSLAAPPILFLIIYF